MLTTMASLSWIRKTKRKLLLRTIILGGFLFVLVKMLGPETVYGTGYKPCKLYKLDPWDNGMKQYFTIHPPLVCGGNKSLPIYMDNDGFLKRNSTAVAEYSIESMMCYYSIAKPWNHRGIEFEEPLVLWLPKFVPSRVFKVNCYLDNATIFQYVFSNVIWSDAEEKKNEFANETDDQPSIIYLGLDSLSRSEAIRKLNLTMSYLKTDLGSYDFEGLLRVGVMTKPNILALLHGQYDSSFDVGWLLDKEYLDHKRFLWDDAADRKAVTLLMEQTIFKYFRRNPVDYFWYQYEQAMETVKPIIIEHLPEHTECYGSRNKFVDHIVYLKQFLTKFKGRRKFAYLHSDSLTHDIMGVERGDTDILDFLRWLKKNGHLHNAVLLFASDHGYRIGVDTFTGRLEINNPVMMVYLPDSLKTKFKWMNTNLKHNTKMLISHYDVHTALKGFIASDYRPEQACSRNLAGQNLFACKLSPQRSCEEAKIPRHFCACDDGVQSIDNSQPQVQTMAIKAVDNINTILEPYKSMCRQLALQHVSEAHVSYRNEFRTIDRSFIDRFSELWIWLSNIIARDTSGKYTVVFNTLPNNGKFDVTVEFDSVRGIVAIDNPVRLDKYGNQSHCMGDNSFLKQFCLCF